MTSTGTALQIVNVLNDHSYQLDDSALKQVLLKEGVKDLPVVVVSVAGAYRGGKSFLLNFFLRYLKSSEAARKDGTWLGDASTPLTGFNWRGGAKRNTTGILLWSEPVIVKLSSGENVAVLLMDTQGTFDSKSTIRDNSTIFALSTLLSSVQIYNLSTNIQEDDLQHLQLFTSYGKLVEDHGSRAFQVLEFLVRDWPYPYDYEYGIEGGNKLLQERLAITPDLAKELRELREHIRSSFESVSCFLMPHPGLKVLSPTFKGNISDLDDNFKTHLKLLTSSLLSSEKMSIKTINGGKIKVGDLYNYFKNYMSLFNSDKIPNPTNILQATAEAGLLTAINEARSVYEKGMDADCGPTQLSMPAADLQDVHRKHLAKAREAVTSKKMLASQDEITKQLGKLTTDLNSRLPQFEQSNLSKTQILIKKANDAYEQKIHDISKDQPLCVHPLDLEKLQQEAVNTALNVFDAGRKKTSTRPDEKRTENIQQFAMRFTQLVIANERNNNAMVKDLHDDYWKFMNTKSVDPPLADSHFKSEHSGAFNRALQGFGVRRNRPNSYPVDVFKNNLIQKINDTFNQLQVINLRKIEQERVKQEQERRRQEMERQRVEQERIRAEQERVRAEQQRIKDEQQRLEREQLERQNELIRIEAQRELQRLQEENERLRNQSSSSSGGCIII